MVGAVVEFAAAVVTGDCAAQWLNTVNGGFTVRANVAVVTLHTAALKGKCVEWLLAWDAQLYTSGLPLEAVGINVAAPASFVGDEVCELVFEGAPELLGLTVAELRIEFDGTIRPPRTPSGGLHAGVPGNPDLAGKFRQGK